MQLGRYQVLGKLATGGMAEVFLAQLSGTNGFEKRVVIKKVLPQYVGAAEFNKLFEQEARFASGLHHPHIAQVMDFGVDEAGAAYLVMEYVNGASLRTLLLAAQQRGDRPDVRLVCRLFSQVAEALAAVHAAVDPTSKQPLELVHRDVSPENVLLSREGAVKLADFGIARAMTQISTTRPDTIRGKVRYLAPEQVLGQPLSSAIDVWALGVSLYETLALKRPFAEENEGQTIFAIANAEMPRVDSVRSDLPPELVALVHRCLAKEPSERYPDCEDLALELERIASSGSGGVTSRMIGNWVERLVPEDPALRALSGQHAVHQPTAQAKSEPLETQQPPTPAPIATPAPTVRPSIPLVAPPRSFAWLRGVLLVVLLAGGAFLTRDRWLPRQRSSALRAVVVTSAPSGAVVKQGSLVLGQTPWAGDVSIDSLELTVDAPGFEPQKRTLGEGQSSLNVVLTKRKR